MGKRTFLFMLLGAALLCLGTAAVSVPTVSAQDAPAKDPAKPVYDFNKSKAKAWDFLADKHCDIAKLYAKEKLYADARDHYNRALYLVTDYEAAKKGLGYKKQDGNWVKDKGFPEDSEGLIGELAKDARARIEKKVTDMTAEMAKKMASLAKEAENNKSADGSATAYGELALYDPNNEAANKSRGWAKVGLTLLRTKSEAATEAGKKLVEAASEGDKIEGEDEQAKAISVSFNRRKAGKVTVRTTGTEDIAKKLMKTSGGAMAVSLALLGKTDYARTMITMTTIEDRTKFEDFAEKYASTNDEKEKEQIKKKLSGTYQRTPYGVFMHHGAGGGIYDMDAHYIAFDALNAARGSSNSAPWLHDGFTYLVTSQALGTCLTKMYAGSKKGGRTGERGRDEMKIKMEALGAYKFRDTVRWDVATGQDLSWAELTLVKRNDMDINSSAKSFSLFEFFSEKYPAEMKKWLELKPEPGRDELKQVEAAFGKPATEVEKEWRHWVETTY